MGVTVDGTMLVLRERLGVGSKIKLKKQTSTLFISTQFTWTINVQLLKHNPGKKDPSIGRECLCFVEELYKQTRTSNILKKP